MYFSEECSVPPPSEYVAILGVGTLRFWSNAMIVEIIVNGDLL